MKGWNSLNDLEKKITVTGAMILGGMFLSYQPKTLTASESVKLQDIADCQSNYDSSWARNRCYSWVEREHEEANKIGDQIND